MLCEQIVSANYPSAGGATWRVLYTENHDKVSGQGNDQVRRAVPFSTCSKCDLWLIASRAVQGRWPNIVNRANPTSYIAQKLSTLGTVSRTLSPLRDPNQSIDARTELRWFCCRVAR